MPVPRAMDKQRADPVTFREKADVKTDAVSGRNLLTEQPLSESDTVTAAPGAHQIVDDVTSAHQATDDVMGDNKRQEIVLNIPQQQQDDDDERTAKSDVMSQDAASLAPDAVDDAGQDEVDGGGVEETPRQGAADCPRRARECRERRTGHCRRRQHPGEGSA